MHTQILKLPAVMARTGLGRSTVFAKIKANQFPRMFKLGARASGWDAEEIGIWIQQRKAGFATPHVSSAFVCNA